MAEAPPAAAGFVVAGAVVAVPFPCVVLVVAPWLDDVET